MRKVKEREGLTLNHGTLLHNGDIKKRNLLMRQGRKRRRKPGEFRVLEARGENLS